MSVARGSTGTAHRLVLFTGCPTDSVSHTDSASGNSDIGYDVRLKPETATTPEQSEGKPSPDSRVVASLCRVIGTGTSDSQDERIRYTMIHVPKINVIKIMERSGN